MVAKALSMSQPYASAVVLDEKLIETRSWRTSYRGTLLIHASARSPHVRNTSEGLVFSEGIPRLLTPRPAVPTGAIIGLCVVYDCRPSEEIREILLSKDSVARYRILHPQESKLGNQGDSELGWGDYSDGRWAWILHGTFELPKPVSCKGALGLWVPDESTMKEVVRQLTPRQKNYYLLNSVNA